MATATLFLRPSSDKSKITVYIKYRHKNKSKVFNTYVTVEKQKWNSRKNSVDMTVGIKRIKANSDLIKDLEKESVASNAKINSLKSKIMDLAKRIQLDDLEPTVEELSKRLHNAIGRKKTSDVFDLFEQYIKDSELTKSGGTIRQYRTAMQCLRGYKQQKLAGLSLNSFTSDFYSRYVDYMLHIGLSNNTIGNRIKILKSFLNYLVEKGYKINSEFKKYKVLKEKPLIIYLTEEELHHLYKYEFQNSRMRKVVDLFAFQAQSGMRYSDLKRVGREHINGSLINMLAFKTKKKMTIPLTPISAEILQKYNFQLPIISEQKMNEYLKEACEIAGIDRKVEITEFKGGKKIFKLVPIHQVISSHKAVNTFISHCGEKGISAKVVSEITGKSVKVILDHYYGTTDSAIIRQMEKAFGSANLNMSLA